MSEKSLYEEYCRSGDIRYLEQLLQNNSYDQKEIDYLANNMYFPYYNDTIPEIEYIIVLSHYYPNIPFSEETKKAIQKTYPNYFEKLIEKNK